MMYNSRFTGIHSSPKEMQPLLEKSVGIIIEDETCTTTLTKAKNTGRFIGICCNVCSISPMNSHSLYAEWILPGIVPGPCDFHAICRMRLVFVMDPEDQCGIP